MKRIRSAVVGAIVAFGVILGGEMARAESILDSTLPVMTLSPMNQQMILVPGEEFHGSIAIANSALATTNLDYKLSIGSFSERADEGSEDDYSVIDVQEVTERNQIMNWITLDRKSGSVAPNGTDVVNFTIKVPKTAPAGGQYATILVENVSNREGGEDEGENDGAGVMIESTVQMASIIYANVAGETYREGVVLENKIPTFSFNKTIEATSMIENQGNVHTEAEVILQVWSAFGGENVCTVANEDKEEGEATTTLVLPDTKRFHEETCELPEVGIYKIKQTVKIFGEESVMEGVLVYLPIWMILMIVFGVVLLIIWLVMMVTGRKKKQIA